MIADALVHRLTAGDDTAGLAALRADDLDDAEGLASLLDHAEGLLHNDPDSAFRIGELCDAATSPARLPQIRARVRYQRAQILADRGKLEAALDAILEARACWLSAGEDLSALRTDLGRMQVLDDLGRHTAAIRVGEDLIAALDIWPHDVTLARRIRAHAVDNLGVAYGLLGRHEAALEAYSRAEAAYLALGMSAEAARPAANRGVELLALGRPREALADFARAIAAFGDHGDRLFAAQCQGDMARAHRQLGEIGDALRLLEEARLTLEGLGAATEAARLQLALAETYLAVGLWREGRSAATSAAESAEHAGMTHDVGMARFTIALADLALGLAGEAVIELDRAEELFAAVDDQQHLARVLLARAEASVGMGQFVQARLELSTCVGQLEDGGWMIPLASALLLQSEAAEDLDAVDRALGRARVVVEDLELPELRYQLELRQGRLARRLEQSAVAESHLRRAISELDRVSDEIPDYALRTSFRSERLAAHSELVDLLVSRGQEGDVLAACQVADDSKARTLTDVLMRTAGTGPSLTTGGADLAATYVELGATYLALQGESDPALRRRLGRRSASLEDHVTALRLRNLTSPARTTSSDDPHRSNPVRVAVPVVAFHVVGGDLVAFVLNDGAITVRRLPKALDRLHLLLDELEDQWSRYAIGLGLGLVHEDSLLRSARGSLAELYVLLVAPIVDALGEAADAVCIVPHGPMGAVPFQALFDGDRYLVERWAITLAPTLAAAERVDQISSFDDGALVVAVADEYTPAAAREARLVAGMMPRSTLLINADATAAAVTRAAGAARVVHLACHGVFRPDNPLFSRLRLGDRWLTAGEIVQLDVRDALVILSACETGLLGRAAEPVGLGWAFLAAGATGVLVSQWAVHDEATVTLMTRLYRQLASGVAPDKALREAQLHTAERYPHPFMWAPFTYVRNPFNRG